MMNRTSVALAGAMALVLCAACASTPGQESEYRETKYYRTGSNIPTRDYGADNIEVGKPGTADSMNRPMGNIVGKKPGG